MCVCMYVRVDFSCGAGEFLDISSDQECHACPAGTFSVGGAVVFRDWKQLPTGFMVKLYSLSSDGSGHTESDSGNKCAGYSTICLQNYKNYNLAYCSSVEFSSV